jgi:predicted HicB family RNase H-like nuclease
MDLRVNHIDPNLMARLKSQAALAQKTLREYVLEVLQKAVKGN